MGLFGSASLLDQGLDAFASKRWRKARRLLEDSGHEEGRPIGDYHLGLLYWRGLGGPRDTHAAVQCFKRAAASGHAAAQTALGLAALSGVGTAQDTKQAQALLRSAAGAGDVAAMTTLATMMADVSASRRLLFRAAESGYPPAMRALSDLILETDPIDALAWLYVHVALTGEEAVIKRAKKVADELTADEIGQAQKQGRAELRRLKSERARA